MLRMSMRLLLLPLLNLTDHTLGKFSWLKSSGMASALLVESILITKLSAKKAQRFKLGIDIISIIHYARRQI